VSNKHEGFLPGDGVKVVDHWNARNPPQIGVVLEVVSSGGVIHSNRIKLVVPGGVTWRWDHECVRIF
jgi:hypothetical protein